MKRFLMFLFALILLPFYPLLRLIARKVGDKMHFCEKVVVVMRNDRGRKIQITQGG